MSYNGETYTIEDGYTNDMYVWWDHTQPTVLQTGNTLPTNLTDADCIVFLNKYGIHLTVPTATILDGDLLVPGSIQAGALAANSVTAENIAAGAVTASAIAADAIGAGAIQANAITGENIVAGSITGQEIAAQTITGNNIAANTITGANIAAATITGNNIAANTITGSNIAANTITADKLTIGNLSNMVPNPNFENDTEGQYPLTGWTGGQNVTVVPVSSTPDTVTNTSLNALAVPCISTNYDNDVYSSVWIPVNPGDTYYIQADCVVTSGCNANGIYVGFEVADKNQSNPSWAGTLSWPTTQQTWLTKNGQFEIPTGYYYMRVWISVQSGSTSGTGTAYFDNIIVRPAVSNNMITSISAGKITTGTMSASLIQGGTLTLGGNNNGNGVLQIENSAGTPVVTGNSQGLTVTNANFLIQDALLGSTQVVSNVQNLVLDHSFELIIPGSPDNNACWTVVMKNGLQFLYPGYWQIGGPQASNAKVFNGSIDNQSVNAGISSIYGKQAAVCDNSSNYYWYQNCNLDPVQGASGSYTVSAWFSAYQGTTSNCSGQIQLWAINSSGQRIGSSPLATYSVSLTTGQNFKWQRCVGTYSGTYPSGTAGLQVVLQSSVAGSLVLADGVQLVAGSYPAVYNPESSMFAQFWGGPNYVTSFDSTVVGYQGFYTTDPSTFGQTTINGNLLTNGTILLGGTNSIGSPKRTVYLAPPATSAVGMDDHGNLLPINPSSVGSGAYWHVDDKNGNSVLEVFLDGTEVVQVNGLLSYGSWSYSANGFTTLPNGMLLQWCSANVTATGGKYNTQVINFPIAFNTLYQVYGSASSGNSYTYFFNLTMESATTTGVTAVVGVPSGYSNTVTVRVLAIGI